MKTINPHTIRRILIRAPNWVGDAVMSTPLARAVRRHFPSAGITVLAKPWVAAVFEHSPDVDHILPYDSRSRHAGLRGMRRLCRDIRQHRFDLAVLAPNSFGSALVPWLAGIPLRLGYDTDGRGILLTHRVRMTKEKKQRHQIDYYLGILDGLSLPASGSDLTLSIPPAEQDRAREILEQNGTERTDGIIGINPGAAYGTAKRWFPERYAELCRKLRSDFPDMPVAVFGGPGEESLGETICGSVGDGCINLCGRTSLREAMALIRQCRLFVTNDSGLMHIAAALDVPQIAIFGPTDHTTTSPAGRRSHIIRVEVPCSPCLERECPPGHHRCMDAVSVTLVYEKAKTLLQPHHETS